MNQAIPLEMSGKHPRENANFLGHDVAKDALTSAYSSGRFPHACLISGPRGIGKATLAFRVARAILSGALDTSKPTLYVPPEHPVFRRIAANAHGSLLTIEKLLNPKTGHTRSEIIIDSIRQLRPFFGQTTTETEAGWRIAIVDAAENMNSSAANALLKLLEEPPVRGIILLVSHASGQLSPTLRSRCRELKLRPLSVNDTSNALKTLFPKLEDDEKRCRLLSQIGEGSIGRAAALSSIDGKLFEDLFGLLLQLPDFDYEAVHALGDRLSKATGNSEHQAINDIMIWWLARAIRIMATDIEMPEMMDGEAELILKLSTASRLDQWVEVWEKIRDLFSSADRLYLSRKQVLLSAFVHLSSAARGAQ